MSWTKDDDDEAVRKSSEEVHGCSEGAQRRMLGEEVVTPVSEVISCFFFLFLFVLLFIFSKFMFSFFFRSSPVSLTFCLCFCISHTDVVFFSADILHLSVVFVTFVHFSSFFCCCFVSFTSFTS